MSTGEEPGARRQEPGARSQEPGARSQEPGVLLLFWLSAASLLYFSGLLAPASFPLQFDVVAAAARASSAISPVRPPWNGAMICTSSFSRWMLSWRAFAYGTAVRTSGVPAC